MYFYGWNHLNVIFKCDENSIMLKSAPGTNCSVGLHFSSHFFFSTIEVKIAVQLHSHSAENVRNEALLNICYQWLQLVSVNFVFPSY